MINKIKFLILSLIVVSNTLFAGYWHGIRINDSLPTIKQVSHITVGIKKHHNRFINEDWKKATKKAIRYLNIVAYDSASAVHFKWVGTSNADILLENSLLYYKVIARTDIGDSTHGIGNQLRINPSYDTLTYIEKVAVMQHELLHTLGFRHSKTGSEISDGSIKVPNTDGYWDWYYANKSIMEQGKIPPLYMNFLDQRALGSVFPKP